MIKFKKLFLTAAVLLAAVIALASGCRSDVIREKNIESVESHHFDESGQSEDSDGITEFSGKEETPALSYTANGSQNFIPFDRVTPLQSSIDAIKIVTPTSKQYYLSYKVKTEGGGDYYSAIDSRNTSGSEYAIAYGSPIQCLKIDVLTNGGSKVTENIVVMYRVYTAADGWLPWVSNAGEEWMESVKLRYNIAGELDAGEDGFA